MNKNIRKFTGLITGMLLAAACSPDSYEYHDNNIIDISTIDSVALTPNHGMLVANGYAQLDLRPQLYTKNKNLIPNDRVDESWLEYNSDSGIKLTRHFSTADASLIGKTVITTVKIKGTNVVSAPVSFQIVAPLDEKYMPEIKIPVVFHIVQTKDDIEKFGGSYTQDRIALHLTKLNNMFSGAASVNPVGVDTRIRLVLALYDQNGRKMPEPGINRLKVDAVDVTNNYMNLIVDQHLDWPVEDYMNIWLISDRSKKIADFANTISEKCTPSYVYAGTPADGRPEGITLREITPEVVIGVAGSGIIYKLQELDEMDRSFASGSKPANNELGYYIGRYLGLLPTCSFKAEPVTDYCDDTHDYYVDPNAPNSNQTWYKTLNGYYFRAENIMDDPRGGHCSISKNQCERIRWILENCPERAAWKSDFAFTGKSKE